jgi:hypothetical protein
MTVHNPENSLLEKKIDQVFTQKKKLFLTLSNEVFSPAYIRQLPTGMNCENVKVGSRGLFYGTIPGFTWRD